MKEHELIDKTSIMGIISYYESKAICEYIKANFSETDREIYNILRTAIINYPLTLNDLYDFVFEVNESEKGKFTLEVLVVLFCNLSVFGISPASAIESVKSSLEKF